jgi:hypothetical protein
VHTGQAGTLARTVAAVAGGTVPVAVGIDEDTCLALPGPGARPEEGAVTGTGRVWVVRPAGDGGVTVTPRRG